MDTLVSIVIPVFNSEQTLLLLAERIDRTFDRLDKQYQIIFVNDASTDQSWHVLKSIKEKFPKTVKIIRLLKNSGQHNAILCGFNYVEGNIIITMDDDLQNPPEEIVKLIDALADGYDLVIASYSSKQHSNLRNIGGGIIDRIQKTIFKLPDDFQLTSFRATRSTVINAVCQMRGSFPYITAMLLAHASSCRNIMVNHEKRKHGKSNYSAKKAVSLALNLLLNYSTIPIYLVAGLCFFSMMVSLAYGTSVLFRALFYEIPVPGWASTIVIISFLNSLTLLALLIFGVYLARIYRHQFRTPQSFVISEMY
jgi:polyisoprenyl-phosphate glycosyltransferase